MNLKDIIEAALLVSQKPLSLVEFQALFDDGEQPDKTAVQAALAVLAEEYAQRPLELKEVATGFRFQVREVFSPWISRLFEERPARYTKAFLETLAIIAYRQPVTRGEIEEIRGVAVSSNIIRSLLERDWVRVVGHKEVPGRPGLYATTAHFLNYFNLKGLDELPPLQTFIDRLDTESSRALSVPDRITSPYDPIETPDSAENAAHQIPRQP
jgi:segregation and condensation protein B